MKIYSYCVVLFFVCIAGNVVGQQENKKLQEASYDYFGINVYGMPADTLIYTIQKLYRLQGGWMRARSADSLFYMNGYTTLFNPFSIPVKKVEFQVRESIVKHTGAVYRKDDTIMVIQVIGLTDTTETSKENVRQEFRKIRNRLANGLYNQTKNSKRDFEHASFASNRNGISDIQAGWAKHYSDRKTYVISITLVCGILFPGS